VYLRGTWLELGNLLTSDPDSVARHVADRRSSWKGEELTRLISDGTINELVPESWDSNEHLAIAEAAAMLYQPARWIWLLLGLSVAAALCGVRDPSRRAVLLPLGVIAAVTLCTVLINGALPRYRYPMDPLLHVTAAAGLVWVAASARGRVWRARASLTSQPSL
jgi:hypothetical protein